VPIKSQTTTRKFIGGFEEYLAFLFTWLPRDSQHASSYHEAVGKLRFRMRKLPGKEQLVTNFVDFRCRQSAWCYNTAYVRFSEKDTLSRSWLVANLPSFVRELKTYEHAFDEALPLHDGELRLFHYAMLWDYKKWLALAEAAVSKNVPVNAVLNRDALGGVGRGIRPKAKAKQKGEAVAAVEENAPEDLGEKLTRLLEADTKHYVTIKRWVDGDYDSMNKAWGNRRYEVRKYPAGTPGGEYQKWMNGEPLYECRSDGRELTSFTYDEKREVQIATVTFEDVFDDIRVLADMLQDTTQQEAIHRDINEEKERFISLYSDERGLDALSGLVALVVRMQQLIPRADKKTSELAAFLVSFCEQMKGIFETGKPYGYSYTLQIKRLLEKYYSSPPLALLLAKLKRLGQW
jgi:hypothetical protein